MKMFNFKGYGSLCLPYGTPDLAIDDIYKGYMIEMFSYKLTFIASG